MFGWSPKKFSPAEPPSSSREVPAVADPRPPPPPPPEEPGFRTAHQGTALVTGSSGLCGARLVEMWLERGGRTVVALDRQVPDRTWYDRMRQAGAQQITVVGDPHDNQPPPLLQQQKEDEVPPKYPRILLFTGPVHGDLTRPEAVQQAFQAVMEEEEEKIDVCFHIAALVGPFHPKEAYYAVNVQGTHYILENCRKFGVPDLIYSSSPSTRFTGQDIRGATEDQLPYPKRYLALYAETKAVGEQLVAAAHQPTGALRTMSVAPHQVYGPYDHLFLPNLLETAGNGRLRIFGSGRNRISVCYVDNYCHGVLCGVDALRRSPTACGGRLYIITDDHDVYFWEMINQAVKAMGFVDLQTKWSLPVWLLYGLAYVAQAVGYLLQRQFKLNPFNVKMLLIDRYFSVEAARRDLQYQPVLPYEQAWPHTIQWFQQHWLPQFLEKQKKKKGHQGRPSKRD